MSRYKHSFNAEPPLYTPSDRLQALHEVAVAARAHVADAAGGGLAETELARAIERLNRIERYLGMPPG